MLGLGLSLANTRRVGSAAGYDAAAQTAFDAMTSAPDATRKGHYNTLITSLKAGGIWTKLDALYVFAAHDAQAGRLNLKTPGTFNCAEVGTLTFTADRGYAAAAASYLNTQYNPATNGVTLLQNSGHISAWNRTARAASGVAILANGSGGGNINLYPRFTDDKTYARVFDGSVGVANTSSDGFFVGNRSDASARQIYRNGASIGSPSIASNAPSSAAIRLLNDGTTANTLDQIAMASIGGSLTAGEVTAFYNAVNTYLVAVGAV